MRSFAKHRWVAPLLALAAASAALGAGESVESLVKKTQSADEKVRVTGLMGLAQIGPKAKQAVPALATVLRKDASVNCRGWAMVALCKIGAIEEALPALDDADQELRRHMLIHLGNLGKQATAAVPRLHEIADRGPKEFFRVIAASTLARIAPTSPEVAARLVRFLESADISEVEKLEAANGLRLTPQRHKAVPFLIQAAKHKDANMRCHALTMLGLIGPAAKDAVPLLIQTLRPADPKTEENDIEESVRAAQSLRSIGTKEARAALLQAQTVLSKRMLARRLNELPEHPGDLALNRTIGDPTDGEADPDDPKLTREQLKELETTWAEHVEGLRSQRALHEKLFKVAIDAGNLAEAEGHRGTVQGLAAGIARYEGLLRRVKARLAK